MEWKENFGTEYRRCQNRMKWKISRIEWKTIFHNDSILNFAHVIYRKKYTLRIMTTKNMWKRLAANYLSTNYWGNSVMNIAQTV